MKKRNYLTPVLLVACSVSIVALMMTTNSLNASTNSLNSAVVKGAGYNGAAQPTEAAPVEPAPITVPEAPQPPVEAATDCSAPVNVTETFGCLEVKNLITPSSAVAYISEEKRLEIEEMSNAYQGDYTEFLPTSVVVDDSTYDRDLFGSGWVDADNNGCDTRNDILARDLVEITVAPDCKVMAGVLNDTYAGKTIQFTRGQKSSMDVQVDHIVSLRNAWYAGARNWTDEQRVAFSNDPLNLKATDGPANNSKGADGPDQWLPQGDTCGYVTSYVNVSYTYQLSITPTVQSAIADVLAGC